MTENQTAAMATASPGRDCIRTGPSQVFVDEGENNTIIKALGTHPSQLVYWWRSTHRCTTPASDGQPNAMPPAINIPHSCVF